MRVKRLAEQQQKAQTTQPNNQTNQISQPADETTAVAPTPAMQKYANAQTTDVPVAEDTGDLGVYINSMLNRRRLWGKAKVWECEIWKI